ALANRLAQFRDNSEMKEFRRFDETCLADKSFIKRANLYSRAEELITEKPFATGKLVGSKGQPLEKFLKERIGAIQDDLTAYTGELKKEASLVLAYQLKRASNYQSDAFLTAWLAEARSQLASANWFPLIGAL